MATQIEVAEFFGVQTRTIRNWSKIAGFPQSKGGSGYSVQGVARWRISYLEALKQSDESNVNPDDLDDEGDLDKAVKQAKLNDQRLVTQMRAFNFSVLKQEFAPITVITRTLERVAVAMSSSIDSLLPHTKRAWPDMPPEAVDVIKKVIAQCKNEVAEIEPDLSEFDPSNFESGEDGPKSTKDSNTSNGG